MALASDFESVIDALPIRARARVLGAKLKVGQSVEYALGERRHAYPLPSSGIVDVTMNDGATKDELRGRGHEDVET